jgi:hypothetical protein
LQFCPVRKVVGLEMHAMRALATPRESGVSIR